MKLKEKEMNQKFESGKIIFQTLKPENVTKALKY